MHSKCCEGCSNSLKCILRHQVCHCILCWSHFGNHYPWQVWRTAYDIMAISFDFNLHTYGHLTETIKYHSWLEQSSGCAMCHSNRCSLHNLIGTPCVVFHWNYFCLRACSKSQIEYHTGNIWILWTRALELIWFELCYTHCPAGITTFWPYSLNVAAQTKTGNVSPHLLLSSF